MSFVDKTLKCRDCGSDFVFTAGEQEFYQQKGLLNEPARCPSCRTARRSSASSTGSRSSDRAPREMHTIICAECGNEAQVPFLPTKDRPVYCSSCFDKVRVPRG